MAVEILKADQAYTDAVARREQITKNAMDSIATEINANIEKAKDNGETKVGFKCLKGFKSVIEVRAELTPKLEEAGHREVNVIACPERKYVWISFTFEPEEK